MSSIARQVRKKGIVLGDTDTCGLCGSPWSMRLNIHKQVVEGKELYCCTRCRNIRAMCDDPVVLRGIADGLEQLRK